MGKVGMEQERRDLEKREVGRLARWEHEWRGKGGV